MIPSDLLNIIYTMKAGMEMYDLKKALHHEMFFHMNHEELQLILSCCFEEECFAPSLCFALIKELNEHGLMYSD